MLLLLLLLFLLLFLHFYTYSTYSHFFYFTFYYTRVHMSKFTIMLYHYTLSLNKTDLIVELPCIFEVFHTHVFMFIFMLYHYTLLNVIHPIVKLPCILLEIQIHRLTLLCMVRTRSLEILTGHIDHG